MIVNLLKKFLNKPINKSQNHNFASSETNKRTQKNQNEHFILVNKEKIYINRKIIWSPLPDNCFQKLKIKYFRHPTSIIIHSDNCLSSISSYNILSEERTSTHFSIDSDGTIYQFVDCQYIAFHSGPSKEDRKILIKNQIKIPKSFSWDIETIGINIVNPFNIAYKKIQNRPTINSKCQNINLHHLGFFEQQINSLAFLVKILTDVFDIPLEHPNKTKFIKECANGSFRGVMCHYHLMPNRIDCAGLDLANLIKTAKEINE